MDITHFLALDLLHAIIGNIMLLSFIPHIKILVIPCFGVKTNTSEVTRCQVMDLMVFKKIPLEIKTHPLDDKFSHFGKQFSIENPPREDKILLKMTHLFMYQDKSIF